MNARVRFAAVLPLIAVAIVLPMTQAHASLSYVLPTTGMSTLYEIGALSFSNVTETYGASDILPNPTGEGGPAIGDANNSASPWFEKRVGFFGSAFGTVAFDVINATPYEWTGYHVEILNPSDTNARFSIATPPASGTGNVMVSSDGLSVWWYDLSVSPNSSDLFAVSLRGLDSSIVDEVIMRQVATTVPIPAALPLLSAALVGFGFVARRRKSPT